MRRCRRAKLGRVTTWFILGAGYTGGAARRSARARAATGARARRVDRRVASRRCRRGGASLHRRTARCRRRSRRARDARRADSRRRDRRVHRAARRRSGRARSAHSSPPRARARAVWSMSPRPASTGPATAHGSTRAGRSRRSRRPVARARRPKPRSRARRSRCARPASTARGAASSIAFARARIASSATARARQPHPRRRSRRGDRARRRDRRHAAPINIADDDPAPIGEVADAVAAQLGLPPRRASIRRRVDPEVAGMLHRGSADRERAHEATSSASCCAIRAGERTPRARG